ncbi:dihydropyrimidinase-like [Carya illinoinensis]|uniref:dihydropyrimidinase-like n=1 Tax=Carya illinoinensis TaxID=32201 RepID=UPI001C71DBA5|nr:dihydropyrimidinase-like [Carya illinoinensis]
MEILASAIQEVHMGVVAGTQAIEVTQEGDATIVVIATDTVMHQAAKGLVSSSNISTKSRVAACTCFLLEGEATAQAIRLAGFVNTPLYVVHESKLPNHGHNKALQAALSTGVLQLVGTDHCSFNSTQKALGIDDCQKILNGVNGIEERMHLVWDTMVESGQISVTDYVRGMSTICARIFNIYPTKVAILPGSDADIIILNPNSSLEISALSHHSRSDTNVYEGRKGKVISLALL